MLDNIRHHSLKVADIAAWLAKKAFAKGYDINVESVRASGLLHDLAKTYCLKYGGSHALLGGAWTLEETGNYEIAQGVILHVHWPWAIPENVCTLPFLVLYADKRVRHEKCVSLTERFEDILIRYGKTEHARTSIMQSWKQAELIEQKLAKNLELNINENPFNCGRMVQ